MGKKRRITAALILTILLMTGICHAAAEGDAAEEAVPVQKITVWGPPEALILGGRPEDAEFRLGFSIEPEDAGNQKERRERCF